MNEAYSDKMRAQATTPWFRTVAGVLEHVLAGRIVVAENVRAEVGRSIRNFRP